MANKILPFDVVLKEINPIRSFYCPKAYTNDLNSVEFQFTLIDMSEAELVGATANVILYMRDKSFFQNTSASGVTLEGNVVKYVMKENEGNHAGIAQVQVEIVYTDPIKIFSSKKYNFEIINALETEIAVEVVVQDLTMILSDAAEYIVAAEAAEAIRLQSEIDRVAAENIRLTNDIDRPIYHYVTQAEYDALTIEEQNDPKHIYEVTDSDGEVLDELTGFIEGMQTQFDNAISGTTVDSETINARVDKSNVVHQTLKKRLDNDKSTTEQSLFSLSNQLEKANTQIKTKTKWELEHAFLGLLKKYNMPDPDFNVFPIKILTDGYQFRYFFDITSFKNTGGTTYYISPTGSDANDGLTEGTARKIFASVPFVNGDTVILLDGIYPRTSWTNDTQIEKSVNIIAKNPGKVIVKNGNDHTYALYSTYTKTYFTARSNVAKAVQIIGNETTELVKVLDIASVEATEGTWYNDGTNTYVHMFYDAVPTNANLALTLLTNKALIHTLCTTSNVSMYVEGIKFIGGNPATVLFSASATYRAPKFYANKCQFLHAYDAAQARDAVSILGATAYFVECEASFSNKDGFNYHQFDGTIAYGLEIDCIAKANGYGNTGGAYNNGSTAHDGSKVIRIGGTYFSNYGANVADVHVNTKSLNIECNAFNSTAGTGDGSDADFAAQQTGTTMWLLSCRGLGSVYNLYCAAGATMYVKDSDYTTKNLSGNIVDVA